MSWFARWRWQVVGLALAAVLIGGFAWVASRDSAGTRPGAAVSPTASPTADPRVAMFKQLTVQFLQALDDSDRTGSASAADALTVPGSQAAGNAGINADISIQNHKNFMVSRLDLDESSWRISPAGIVDVRYSVFGHEATWPSLAPLEADHERGPFAIHLEFEDFNGQWLVNVVR